MMLVEVKYNIDDEIARIEGYTDFFSGMCVNGDISVADFEMIERDHEDDIKALRRLKNAGVVAVVKVVPRLLKHVGRAK